MIYTRETKLALGLCFAVHKEQQDKSGLPYVFHPFHLAEQMPDAESVTVALLHDALEDSDYTPGDLARMGFSSRVISALQLLTHDPDVPYFEYVARLKTDPLARRVKLADLRHNSDSSRLDTATEADLQRLEKYRAAIALLEKES